MGRFTLDYSNCVFAQLQIWIFYRVSKIISLMLHVWNIYQHLPSFTIIYPINEPNVGKYTIHGASGYIQPLKMIEPCNPVGFTKTVLFFIAIAEVWNNSCDRCNLCQIPTTTVQMRSWSWSPMENTFLGEDLGRFGSVKNPGFAGSGSVSPLDVPINGTSRIWIYFYGRSRRFLLWEILTIFTWMSLVSLDELTRVPWPCRVTGLGIWGSEHQRAHPNCEPHGSGHLLLDVGPMFSLCNSSLFHTHWLFFSHLYIPK
jgi:hypothetical protein